MIHSKSRHVICDYAAYKDPTIVASASYHNFSRLVELKANRQKYPTLLFDVMSMNAHAIEDGKPHWMIGSNARIDFGGPSVVHGRRKGAMSWQELFHGIVTSGATKKEGFTVKVVGQSPITSRRPAACWSWTSTLWHKQAEADNQFLAALGEAHRFEVG